MKLTAEEKKYEKMRRWYSEKLGLYSCHILKGDYKIVCVNGKNYKNGGK